MFSLDYSIIQTNVIGILFDGLLVKCFKPKLAV